MSGETCACTDRYCCTRHRREAEREAFMRRLGIAEPVEEHSTNE